MTLSPNRSHGPRSTRAGFTLIEHLMTVTVLGIAAAGLAPLMMTTARHTTVAQAQQYEEAALSGMASRYGAMSFATLAAGTTCANRLGSDEPLPRRECVTITDSAGVLRVVRLVVTPADTARLKPDTLVMRRVRTLSSNPLNAP